MVLALVLFGVAFGYVEAVVVVYIRDMSEPMRLRYYPNTGPLDLFPIPTPKELRSADQGRLWDLVWVEILREAATLVMLVSIALLVGTGGVEKLAAFVVVFGVWDLAYYCFLKIVIGWPASLLTWDLLFLFPVPWSGPVLAPVIVSCSMIASGAVILRRRARNQVVGLSTIHWAGIVLGAVIILASFTWDYRTVLAGRMPHPFEWPLFAAGEAIGLANFLYGMHRGSAWHYPRRGAL